MYSAKELAIARLIKPDIEVAQLDVTDLAVLQLVRKATGGGSGVYNAKIENGIATFGGVVASSPLVSLLLNIPITQTGSGTPSPDNKRDFIGFSGVTITRNNGVDTGDTYPISFGQTVYSAILDVLTGILSITHEIVDLADLSYQYRETYELFYSSVNRSVKLATPNCACTGYLFNPNAIDNSISAISRELNNKEITTFKNENNQGRFVIKDTNYTDVASLKAAIAGIKLLYELAEPIEIQLTPTVINTLIGENVIFADVGDITECKYTRK